MEHWLLKDDNQETQPLPFLAENQETQPFSFEDINIIDDVKSSKRAAYDFDVI